MIAPPAPFQVFIIWLARAAFVVGLVLVIVLSLVPASTPVPQTGLSDKVEHFIAYLALAATAVMGFHGRRARVIIIFSLLGLGILMEIGQLFSPGRVTSSGDVIANALGVMCGATLGSLGVRALDALRPLVKAQ